MVSEMGNKHHCELAVQTTANCRVDSNFTSKKSEIMVDVRTCFEGNKVESRVRKDVTNPVQHCGSG